MKKIVFALAALCLAAPLGGCTDPVPPVDYGDCMAELVEDHASYTSYEYTMGGISMSGGVAMPGSGNYRLVVHPGWTERTCTQWEFPEGRPEAPR